MKIENVLLFILVLLVLMFFFAMFNPFFVPWWAQDRGYGNSFVDRNSLSRILKPCKLSCGRKVIFDFRSKNKNLNPSGKLATSGALCKDLRDTWREEARKRCKS